MDIFSAYQKALYQNLNPTLLEFWHPKLAKKLKVLAIKPAACLEVRDNKLYINGKASGSALDIFSHLKFSKGKNFFPAFLGYFSYEFARYFGKPVSPTKNLFPDAFFWLYQQGIVQEDKALMSENQTQYSFDTTLLTKYTNLSQRSVCPQLAKEKFFEVVDQIQNLIRQGEVYQVNISLPFNFDADEEEMILIYLAMRKNNPSPFMGIMNHNDWWLLSGSPERLFYYDGSNLETRPIAGTMKRGNTLHEDNKLVDALLSSSKENAEHVMLVDLLRNDMNQVCKAGSVFIKEDRSVEFYSHVMHLVSQINGITSDPLSAIMKAIFPGGTITGAPKTSVMKAISMLETSTRGPYTGSFGYISAGYGVDLNIVIRSVLRHKNKNWINAGAGIIIDSDKNNEWLEINKKAGFIKDILCGRDIPIKKRATIKGPMVVNAPVKLDQRHKVLFIENEDSFSFNIVDCIKTLGNEVHVVNKDYYCLHDYSHVVLGPGPGNPSFMPGLAKVIRNCIELNIPLLGICLGHQAIGHYFGIEVKKMDFPIHGKSQPVFHFSQGLFSGLDSPLFFTRYHSLVLKTAPANFHVDAYTKDDSIMAISHKIRPIFGLQFHPESYLSKNGQIILQNFLRIKADVNQNNKR